jgi:hypothetical protein
MLLVGRGAGHSVVLQVVSVHVLVCKTTAWRNVEVAYHLVDTKDAFHSATFTVHRLELILVALALTLLDVVTNTESPCL